MISSLVRRMHHDFRLELSTGHRSGLVAYASFSAAIVHMSTRKNVRAPPRNALGSQQSAQHGAGDTRPFHERCEFGPGDAGCNSPGAHGGAEAQSVLPIIRSGPTTSA